MKNINTLLTEFGIEVPEGKKAEFEKAVAENYKTTAEVEKLKTKLDKASEDLKAANGTIEELRETAKGTESAEETIKGLNKKLEEYQTAEAERKAAEEAAQVDAQLTATINEYLASDSMKDKVFVNDYTKKSIVDNVKAELNNPANKGKSVGDLFTAITKDQEGIYKNPQEPLNIPGVGNINPGETDPNKMTYEQYKAWRNPRKE